MIPDKPESFIKHCLPSFYVVFGALAIFVGPWLVMSLTKGETKTVNALLWVVVVLMSIYWIAAVFFYRSELKWWANLPGEVAQWAQEQELEREQNERAYLAWCEPQNKEERLLQGIYDVVLREYSKQLEGLPRIKVVAENLSRGTGGEYWGGFDSNRKPGGQRIAIKRSIVYSEDLNALESIIKHELVHAWIDWKDICGYHSHEDDHCVRFHNKARELGV
jgi:Zn-dependent protease with chaperone function